MAILFGRRIGGTALIVFAVLLIVASGDFLIPAMVWQIVGWCIISILAILDVTGGPAGGPA